MNQQIFDSAYQAYQAGDWAAAASALAQAKDPGEVAGRLDHLRGNALMQIGAYDDAATAYADALADASYGMVGALCTNRGRALVAAGRLPEAIESLEAATRDASYATPYKAYLALGGAYRAKGEVRSAGIAYRKAAIDETNPNPTLPLRKLGSCFMDLNRAADAIESFRTALDFSRDSREKNAVYCELGLAYVAANRMNEAVDAFEHACADGTYTLSAEAQASYDAARNAVAARSAERRPSDTDDLLASAGYGNYPVDPLDPTGATSADLMPSPEDTGFFSLSEEELVNDERRQRKGHGRRVLVVLLVILLIVCGAAGFGYYSGYGWPTQESVVQSLFDAKTSQTDPAAYVDASLSDEDKDKIVSLIPADATLSITGVIRSMKSSEVFVTALLSEGGEQSYEVSLVRDGIGWKVSALDPQFASLDDGAADAEKDESADDKATEEDKTDEAKADDAQQEGDAASNDEAAPAEEASDAEVSEGTVPVD